MAKGHIKGCVEGTVCREASWPLAEDTLTGTPADSPPLDRAPGHGVSTGHTWGLLTWRVMGLLLMVSRVG